MTLDAETVDFLEGGCSLVVGAVTADGEPHATRGWGLTFTDAGDQPRVRLLLDGDDARTLDDLASGGAIAVTGADVTTCRSVQLKGHAERMEAATADDEVRAARFCDAFFGNVGRIDGTPRVLLDRLAPTRFAACIVRVVEIYDQTPGPGAGARIAPTV